MGVLYIVYLLDYKDATDLFISYRDSDLQKMITINSLSVLSNLMCFNSEGERGDLGLMAFLTLYPDIGELHTVTPMVLQH